MGPQRAHLNVRVEKGIVTPTGSVSSEEERTAIEHAASHIAGARGITERIEVRWTAEQTHADAAATETD
jgi:osmotically-inducible protein OsmY